MFLQNKSKKAVSIMVGYIILISFAIVIGLIVFQWAKTYVPHDELNCPDGVSIFITDYTCSGDILSLNLKNNGKFSLGGYFIYATDSPEETLATIDLSKNNTDKSSILSPTGIKLKSIAPRNAFLTNDEDTDRYNITGINGLYSIELLPIRWQKEKNRNVLVSCKDAEITEIIECNVGK